MFSKIAQFANPLNHPSLPLCAGVSQCETFITSLLTQLDNLVGIGLVQTM